MKRFHQVDAIFLLKKTNGKQYKMGPYPYKDENFPLLVAASVASWICAGPLAFQSFVKNPSVSSQP